MKNNEKQYLNWFDTIYRNISSNEEKTKQMRAARKKYNLPQNERWV